LTQGRERFLFEKRSKKFFKLGRAGLTATGPVKQKVFAALFLKTAAFF
jgi:hypothetical protein